ncbi:hypothetical protein HPB50_004534 [Hyalomma asiaticum]|uniref:Uncharacterized protein n=1 Tax=Hyalomma asiaticum TaxID=266040 RepID=A0ACB7S1G2_HYAAI|nr:hypothetical protein HPB50_004534 [Hyalomma asiaticum]
MASDPDLIDLASGSVGSLWPISTPGLANFRTTPAVASLYEGNADRSCGLRRRTPIAAGCSACDDESYAREREYTHVKSAHDVERTTPVVCPVVLPRPLSLETAPSRSIVPPLSQAVTTRERERVRTTPPFRSVSVIDEVAGPGPSDGTGRRQHLHAPRTVFARLRIHFSAKDLRGTRPARRGLIGAAASMWEVRAMREL